MNSGGSGVVVVVVVIWQTDRAGEEVAMGVVKGRKVNRQSRTTKICYMSLPLSRKKVQYAKRHKERHCR